MGGPNAELNPRFLTPQRYRIFVPVPSWETKVALNVAVEGAFDAVADAVAKIRGDLPSDASVEITGT